MFIILSRTSLSTSSNTQPLRRVVSGPEIGFSTHWVKSRKEATRSAGAAWAACAVPHGDGGQKLLIVAGQRNHDPAAAGIWSQSNQGQLLTVLGLLVHQQRCRAIDGQHQAERGGVA